MPMDIKTQKEDLLKIKKFLSFVLRHKPFLYKIKLDAEGYANIDELLEKLKNLQKIELSKEEFIYVAKDLSGGIFKLDKDRNRICARFGHTFMFNMNVPEGFEETKELPAELFFMINNNDLTPLLKTEFIPCSNKFIKLYKVAPVKQSNCACCRVNLKKIDVKNTKFYYSKSEDCYFTRTINLSSISLNV